MSYFTEVQKRYRPPLPQNFSLTTPKNNFLEWKMGWIYFYFEANKTAVIHIYSMFTGYQALF